jgi:alpha-D-ribose 1-methylphosphonate 5-phosphate C-P lyase
MARAETGALVNLWYRNVLGPDGYIHEITLGEVRHGRVPVRVLHPHTERPVTIGTVRVTEVEAIEDLVRNGVITRTTGYPVLVNGRYVMATTPIPRWDVPRLDGSEVLFLFGAGREKRVYAVPPHTKVEPLTFEDVPFEVERTEGAACVLCRATEAYLIEVPERQAWVCSDTDWCERQRQPATGAPGLAESSSRAYRGSENQRARETGATRSQKGRIHA